MSVWLWLALAALDGGVRAPPDAGVAPPDAELARELDLLEALDTLESLDVLELLEEPR